MQISPSLLAGLALSFGLAGAADSAQKPLGEQFQAWYEKAKSYVPSAVSSPVDTAASNVAAHTVTNVTASNWKTLLSASSGDSSEEWMILFSGGNKTCRGQCAPMENAWNRAVTVLAAEPAKKQPRLGYVNCDASALLCTTIFAAPPTIWHVVVPSKAAADAAKAAGTEAPKTDVRVIHVNTTTVTSQGIVDVHSKAKYKEVTPLEGYFHPFDGLLARTGLQIPLGYVLFVFALIPSWSMMLIISFVTRTFMSRRLGNQEQNQQARRRMAPPMGGAPAADEPPVN